MNLSFRGRVLGTVAIACLICTSAAVVISRTKLESEGQKALANKSRAILSRLEIGRTYIAEMQMLDSVIAETIRKYPDGNLSGEQKLKILKTAFTLIALLIG